MASQKTKRIITYLLNRLQEPSTLRGLILIACVAGANLSPEAKEAWLEIGLLLSGLFAVSTPDKWKTKDGVKPYEGAKGPTYNNIGYGDYPRNQHQSDDEYNVDTRNK